MRFKTCSINSKCISFNELQSLFPQISPAKQLPNSSPLKKTNTTHKSHQHFYYNISVQTLGELMCSIIPTCQILGVTASSASLVAIALDRYRNVVHALSKRWNPGLFYCLLGTTIGWLACAGN